MVTPVRDCSSIFHKAKLEMKNTRTKLIAYWSQYKLVLKEIPITQKHVVIESFHHDWTIDLYEYEYKRIPVNDWFMIPLNSIRAINLERYSLEFLDYLCAKYKCRFVR